ncbi:HpcH/HpaI aldolase/citrate lyase family protein [Chloroflexota bacterium]
MRKNKVKELWREGQAPTFAWLSTADTYIAEAVANVGFDAMLLDMQHGMTIGPDRAGQWLQAVSTTDTVPMVRVPWNEPFFIQWALDAGAYGIIVPLVNNREEAAKAGMACRYPPLGYRSFGPNRVRFYAGADYAQKANEEIVCLVMIEDIKTVARIEELAEAPGIDGFYIGPADLAISLGIPPMKYLESDKHAEACQKVLNVAKDHNLVAGVQCASPEEVVQRVKQGFMLSNAVNDVGAVTAGANTALKKVLSARAR